MSDDGAQIKRVEANLSLPAMEAAIPKIERRIAELEAFDVNSIEDRMDPRISTLESKLDALMTSVFGVHTVEYARYARDVTHLDRANINVYKKPTTPEIQEGLTRGIAAAKTQLQSIRDGFIEEIEDAGRGVSAKPLKAYEGLELHPVIEKACGALFKDGHYSNAIEDAVKALNGLVRVHSGIDNKDGTSLMETVFNPSKPILKFNDLADQSDAQEQKGFMMMFSGAVAGLRNPRAHKLIQDDPEKSLEFIAFVSLLAKLTESTKR
ncbi:TIGR02391 family protein [Salaquimonas pukyongi]|uniref:TIGR02391 family protein n=1 Tax=Salaquimonas pukyongi TaxID=2712698 RepID=UPI00096B7924|nr:TIGR02391 family protein [Salaquimonas pukyongi]